MSVGLFLSVALMASGNPSGPVRHPTYVRADADDDLTQKFAEALRAALPQAKHMKPEGGDDPDDLSLVLLFPVEQDGKRFSYAIDLMKKTDNPTPDRLASLTGTCNEKAIDACALGVVKKADGKVED